MEGVLSFEDSKIGDIYHWRKPNSLPAVLPQRYSIPDELTNLTKQEYLDVAFDVSAWTYEETLYLLEMMQTYNYNFIVVHDRYSFSGKTHAIEELKEVLIPQSSTTTRSATGC